MDTATAFHHMALSCSDPLAIERFYTKHFGFKRARVVSLGTEQVVFIKAGNVYLELFQAKNTGPAPVGGAGPDYPAWRHLAFKVDDVDATLSRMGADARVTLGPLSFEDFIPGWRTVWVADPDGNVIEISQGFVDQPNPPSLEPGEAAVDTDARAQWADRVWRGDDTGGPGATPAPSGGAGASTANVLDQAQWADHVWRGDEQRPTGRPASGAAGRS